MILGIISLNNDFFILVPPFNKSSARLGRGFLFIKLKQKLFKKYLTKAITYDIMIMYSRGVQKNKIKKDGI